MSERSAIPPSLSAIVARGVRVDYVSAAETVHALKGVDLDIARGELLLLMGPSGSGKTTLLTVLGGLLAPTAGTVRVFSRDLTGMSRDRLARFRLANIGFLFQGFNLFAALNAFENVQLALQLRRMKTAESRRACADLLERVGLRGKEHRLPRDLSGGEKQRVALARALVTDPAIVMADEPTASLDADSGHAVMSLLRDLCKEQARTVLVVTHDARLEAFADRVLRLEDGALASA